MTTARPLSEWTEDNGDVLWWRFPVTETPYIRSPLSLGYNGWPGYHTHWTPLPEIPERAEDVGEREYRSWFVNSEVA